MAKRFESLHEHKVHLETVKSNLTNEVENNLEEIQRRNTFIQEVKHNIDGLKVFI